MCELFSRPFALLRRLRRDPQFFRCWREDLRYYRACGFFDGREPSDLKKLSAFAVTAEAPSTCRRVKTVAPALTVLRPPRGATFSPRRSEQVRPAGRLI